MNALPAINGLSDIELVEAFNAVIKAVDTRDIFYWETTETVVRYAEKLVNKIVDRNLIGFVSVNH